MTNSIAVDSPAEQESRRPTEDVLGDAVARAAAGLQAAYLREEPNAVRAMAILRRDPDGRTSESWTELYSRMPESLYGAGDERSRAERCFALVLSLFATHQQGRQRQMHHKAVSLGSAVRQLMDDRDSEAPSMRRFKTLGAASTWDGQVHHLRGLIGQLRAEDVALDYGQLARDLYRLQNPRTADSVRQRWGRDVHRGRPKQQPDNDPTTAQSGTSTERQNR